MGGNPDSDAILYAETDDIGVITLNRAEQLNTFRRQDYIDLLRVIEAVRNARVRVLIVTGKGRAFSAGQDLAELQDGAIHADDQRALLDTLQSITRGLGSLDIPTIVAFNGFAVGAGLEMALACDFRIATAESYFMFAEAKRGLFPTNGVLWFLPRLVGMAHARAMLLSGRRFDAMYAHRIGLINEIATGDVMAHAMKLADELAQNAPSTIAGVKTLLRGAFDVSLGEMMEREIEYNEAVARGPDFAEGIRAFLEKRKPDFRR